VGAELRRLGPGVLRLGDELAYVDLVETRAGTIRVGGMPEVSKLLRRWFLFHRFVLVPPVVTTPAGDTVTGEEFVFWTAILAAKMAGTYVGRPRELALLRAYLAECIPFQFTADWLRIRRTDWLDRLYAEEPAGRDGTWRAGPVTVELGQGRCRIRDGRRVVYDAERLRPRMGVAAAVERALARVRRDGRPRARPEVIPVGTGNGFAGRSSSFLIRYGDRRLWIDPCGRPHEALAAVGVHWDDVTDYLVTHVHEDHIGGLTACVARAAERGERMRVLTTPSIRAALTRRCRGLAPRAWGALDFVEVVPGVALDYGGAEILTRLNHHPLPSGTLGLKLRFGQRAIGISGDTKYDEVLVARLDRKELAAEWFADCDLVFHEVDPVYPQGVHSSLGEVLKLQRGLRCPLYAYHTVADPRPLSLAREGRVYRL
jgi:L-ascorbate metabolism protein UlaG (beta-lactamase superfamily)